MLRDFLNFFRFRKDDVGKINQFFLVLAVLSVIVIRFHCGSTRAAAAPLLWALACASFGAAFGFLFGIPKILQSGTLNVDSNQGGKGDYRQQVNTNLTEISDWLTKIIVGLGLINLSGIPVRLNNAAGILAASLNGADPTKDKAFALALILCYLILGFLFGYLSTRLLLQAAFSRADQAAGEAQSAITARLTSLETKQEFILSGGTGAGDLGIVNAAQPNGTEEPAIEDVHPGLVKPAAPDTAAPNAVALSLLRARAISYLNIKADSLSERIRLKNQAATEMLNYILTKKIPKRLVYEEADNTGNEGLVLALANFILTYPEKGDMMFLLRLANRVDRLHVRYRIVQALGELFDKNCATSADAGDVQRTLDAYERSADESLLSLIKGTRTRINAVLSQERVAAK